MKTIPDQAIREQALDVRRSFIVQAPAGSGKTELLIQRYLSLLATVSQPEHILAITFTRKAAAEMLARVTQALQQASESEPKLPHQAKTWQLARAALNQSEHQRWQLMQNPHRLRIQTIDGLCHQLAHAAPFSSQMGFPPTVTTQTERLYRHAVQTLCADIVQGDATPEQRWLQQLLHHFDNRRQRLETLLIELLAKREQWLPLLMHHQTDPQQGRKALAAGLQQVIEDALASLRRQCLALTPAQQHQLLASYRFAAEHCQRHHPNALISHGLDQSEWPNATVDALPFWQGLAELLLTKEGDWRRQLTIRQGFPAKSAGNSMAEKQAWQAAKDQALTLLSALTELPQLRARLAVLSSLPAPHLEAAEWQLIEPLFGLLILAVAYLNLSFRQQKTADFGEIAQAARLALGRPEAPSDLALLLDHRLHHILLDEFQDTSAVQFNLLRQLIAGWQAGDGRTLFLVGDPMQSIYRFRAAEVGLFIQARREGIGNLRLHSLQLQCNFRSDAALVAWNNRCFADLFPYEDDIPTGAIRFAASRPRDPEAENNHPGVALLPCADEAAENAAIIATIRDHQRQYPHHHIAILTTTRPAVHSLLRGLAEHRIPHRATELLRLDQQPFIQDLLSLVSALHQPADRIAWLSLLRAPWCGLELADLLVFSATPTTLVWEQCHQSAVIDRLSPEGRVRLLAVRAVLDAALSELQRPSTRHWVEDTWRALKGPACLPHADAMTDVQAFFQQLEASIDATTGFSLPDFKRQLGQCYTSTHHPDPQAVSVMTIHKSKGLEFDAVILPRLHRVRARDRAALLLWHDYLSEHGERHLLLAPIKPSRGERHSLYDYIQRQHALQAEHETLRLLYVATTRARHRLWLSFQSPTSETSTPPHPPAGSLLRLLWPKLSLEGIPINASAAHTAAVENTSVLHRLPLSEMAPAAVIKTTPPATVCPISGDLLQRESRWGTAVHEIFEKIASYGLARWEQIPVALQQRYYRTILQRLGWDEDTAEAATMMARLNQTLATTLADPRGRWILSPHRAGACEQPLETAAGCLGVMDRTFIDEQGRRWIIDYKLTALNAPPTVFLAQAHQNHRAQLEQYARWLSSEVSQDIELGLYFPEHALWYAWSYPNGHRSKP